MLSACCRRWLSLDAPTAMYHFISGYTAKVAGTEDLASTSPRRCSVRASARPFLPLHPGRYADMLGASAWPHMGPRCGWSIPVGPEARTA